MGNEIRIQRVEKAKIEELKVLANELGFSNYQDLLRCEIDNLLKNRQATDEFFEKFSEKLTDVLSNILASNSKTQDLIGRLIEIELSHSEEAEL